MPSERSRLLRRRSMPSVSKRSSCSSIHTVVVRAAHHGPVNCFWSPAFTLLERRREPGAVRRVPRQNWSENATHTPARCDRARRAGRRPRVVLASEWSFGRSGHRRRRQLPVAAHLLELLVERQERGGRPSRMPSSTPASSSSRAMSAGGDLGPPSAVTASRAARALVELRQPARASVSCDSTSARRGPSAERDPRRAKPFT